MRNIKERISSLKREEYRLTGEFLMSQGWGQHNAASYRLAEIREEIVKLRRQLP